MKFSFKKRKPSQERKVTETPESSFYSQNPGEASLDEYSSLPSARQTHRTSKHSPVRRRETSNRASNWALAMLLFRAVLIVFLLVGGFIVLKLVLTRLAEPSEKQQKQWEKNALLMEKAASVQVAAPSAPVPTMSPELIQQKLKQWEQTARHLRAAEAFDLRGIDEDAIQELNQALQSSPNNLGAQKLLLDIYMNKKMYAEATPLCIRLLGQTGPQQELLMDLLISLQSSGQTDAGLILAENILLDQPNNQTVLSIAAAGQVAKGNTDAALKLFLRMLELNSKNIDARLGCGAIYFNRGDYAQAIPHFMELIRLDPRPEHYKALALSCAQQNDSGRAVIFMGQANSLFGGGAVSPWLKDAGFDPIRETADFRSFADRLVGAETRKAIEALNKREAEKTGLQLPATVELPAPRLEVIRPSR